MAVQILQGDARRLPLDDRSVDLTFGSPPYIDARRYGRDDIALGTVDSWNDVLMLEAIREASRVTRGLVCMVCAGVTRGGTYVPGPEALVYRAHQLGICCWPPAIWVKNGVPGSGGKQGLRRDWEYVLLFKHPGDLPWADNLACGTPPKYPRGGRMRNRGTNDRRCDRPCPLPKLANPGNVIRVPVGGGHLGHPLAHQNEAPFPEALAEFFIKSYCPPGGTVLDPFCGSGTTVAVARRLGRNGIGVDLRASQVSLATTRAADPRYDPPAGTSTPSPLPAVRSRATPPPTDPTPPPDQRDAA